MLRPSRPEKARVGDASSGYALPMASAHVLGILASGVLSSPVPICTVDAPSSNAAAIPRASAIPPVATHVNSALPQTSRRVLFGIGERPTTHLPPPCTL